jgi:dinuclear metal center YbgI/SA1388 family protein
MPTVRDVLSALHDIAPAGSAQSYDNVGLQIGDPNQNVSRIVVALDLAAAVVDQAIDAGAELIVTHHPIIFKPVRDVVASDSYAGLVHRVARAGLSHIAIHTNLDAAWDGVSFALARKLGLTDLSFIEPMPDVLQKLVLFVPHDHLHDVRSAIAAAGGGVIGQYDSCAFASEGIGFFRALDGANPFIGKAGGDLEHAQEYKLEVEAPKWRMPAVIAGMKQAHPYEEVAHDIYDLRTSSTRHGLGAVGSLDEAMTLAGFLDRVRERLKVPALRFVGNPDAQVARVAVCGGSGSSFISQAMKTGADVYLTADVTYHRFFEVLRADGSARMALIDAGHYETEAMTAELLVDILSERFVDVDVRCCSASTNPITYWPGDSSHEIKR